jgi:general secretion pathway protein F
MTTISYAYRAMRADGSWTDGSVDAETAEHAANLIAGRGWFPVEITEPRIAPLRRRGIPVRDLALGLRILANLLDAGLPVGKAMIAFQDLAPGSWRDGLLDVMESIRQGRTLADALANSQLAVPPLVIGIVHAGEAGAGLAAAVRRAATLMESAANTRAAVRSALTYPAILAVAACLCTGLLVGVVLPKFAAILDGLGQSLPKATAFVLNVSTVSRQFALPVLAVGVCIWIAWAAWTRTDDGRYRWHLFLLLLPGVGPLRSTLATARCCSALASLLESGVPLPAALKHAARAMDDRALSERLLHAREAVMTGERLGAAIEANYALTPVAIRLVRAGEESGQLATMLAHAAILEQERGQERIQALVRLFEPTLILVFGGIVAFVAAALLQAVYTVRPV